MPSSVFVSKSSAHAFFTVHLSLYDQPAKNGYRPVVKARFTAVM